MKGNKKTETSEDYGNLFRGEAPLYRQVPNLEVAVPARAFTRVALVAAEGGRTVELPMCKESGACMRSVINAHGAALRDTKLKTLDDGAKCVACGAVVSGPDQNREAPKLGD